MPKTVNLTWNNSSSGITEQLVERSVTDGAFVQIGTTPPDQNSFIDNVDEFVDETKLSYKVSSNYIHEGTVYSASSSIFDIVINQSPASNEMTFSTTNGSLSYKGIPGDVITLSDGTTYTVLGDGGYSNENVPAGKHKVVLAKTRSHGRVSIGGAALTELHNFPTLSTVTDFNFYPNTPSPNLVKVPAVLPSNITSLNQMFSGATSFNQDISMWNVSKVTNMNNMFSSATSFNQDLSQWCVPGEVNNSNFATDSSLQLIHFPVWGTCPRGEVPVVTIIAPGGPYTVGNTYQLAYNYNLDPGTVTSVEWVSNTGAVTVDNTGLMTAVSVGDAFVYVTINGTVTNRIYVVVSA